VVHAANRAVARQAWTETPDLDAWIIYNIWQVSNPKLADLVTVSRSYTVYRSSGAALTRKGKESQVPARFLAFLQSREGAAIFKKWGWMAP
jgi:accessory colonization factor AcfC